MFGEWTETDYHIKLRERKLRMTSQKTSRLLMDQNRS